MPVALFVHNGIPGRFAFLAKLLVAQGWTGALINGEDGRELEGLPTARWKRHDPPPAESNPLLREVDASFLAGERAASTALKLRKDGFRPDIIVGHPGWGEMLFLREVFPDTPQIQIGELYYLTRGAHFNFDPEFPVVSLQAHVRQQLGNAALALSHAQATRIVAPTPFQASTFPGLFQPLIRVIHEGVDTAVARPIANPSIRLAGGLALDGSTPVITFINRRFEPMRGFHIFMRALPKMFDALPDAHVLLVGMDDPGTYMQYDSPGLSWKTQLMTELGDRIDRDRVHFTGALPYPQLLRVLSLSWAHIYLTYPFVLSWSLLDAMACECVVIGSDTAPVRDLIRHGENGLLVDFFDADALAGQVIDVCRSPEAFQPLGRRARETVVENWDRDTVCAPKWMTLIEETMAGSG